MLNKILFPVLISMVFCFDFWNIPELRWNTVSIGVMGGGGGSATFNTDNILYGIDILTFGLSYEFSDSGYYDDDYYDDDDIGGQSNERSMSATIFLPKVGYIIDKIFL